MKIIIWLTIGDISGWNGTDILQSIDGTIGGEENSEGKTKNKVRERKSSSVSDREATISSSKTNSSDTRSSKACKVSPNPGCISFYFLIFPLWLFSCVYIFWTLILSCEVPPLNEHILSNWPFHLWIYHDKLFLQSNSLRHLCYQLLQLQHHNMRKRRPHVGKTSSSWQGGLVLVQNEYVSSINIAIAIANLNFADSSITMSC